MKLQPDRLDVQSILGYGPGWIGLGNQGVAEKIEQSIVIGSRGEKFAWDCARFEDLTPAHFERPLPGKLVLFPSYMWHGTAPFTSAQARTTIAFDIVPA